MRRPYIAVVGAGACDPELSRLAEETGRAVARRGAVLVCGGLGGVMEAACRGAKAEGGITLGLLPGDDRSAANPFVDLAVATGLGEARNALVVRAADGLIAIGGEFGTLSEIAFALKIGRPVVGLRTWTLHREGLAADPIARATDPAEAAERVLRSIPGTAP